jgi:hypothetical protein
MAAHPIYPARNALETASDAPARTITITRLQVNIKTLMNSSIKSPALSNKARLYILAFFIWP